MFRATVWHNDEYIGSISYDRVETNELSGKTTVNVDRFYRNDSPVSVMTVWNNRGTRWQEEKD